MFALSFLSNTLPFNFNFSLFSVSYHCSPFLKPISAAECANGCNGHGKCTSYDMCICNRNWQANDCSERVCQFGLAHVDTPKVRAFVGYV